VKKVFNVRGRTIAILIIARYGETYVDGNEMKAVGIISSSENPAADVGRLVGQLKLSNLLLSRAPCNIACRRLSSNRHEMPENQLFSLNC
jgi:hypothetical protein